LDFTVREKPKTSLYMGSLLNDGDMTGAAIRNIGLLSEIAFDSRQPSPPHALQDDTLSGKIELPIEHEFSRVCYFPIVARVACPEYRIGQFRPVDPVHNAVLAKMNC
jgi:hypothetical protein